MAKVISGPTANHIFRKILSCLDTDGIVSKPRGHETKEITNLCIVLSDPLNNFVHEPARKLSKKYLKDELEWYRMANLDLAASKFIIDSASFWGTLVEPNGTLNSNYGYYYYQPMKKVHRHDKEFLNVNIHDKNNESQYEYCLNKLINDKHSRQAVVNINNIIHKIENPLTKDFPCTLSWQFRIIDNVLTMTVNMRSTDVILGYCNDIFQFTKIHLEMYNSLRKHYDDLKIGEFTLFTNSMHIYERHYNMMNSVLSTEDMDENEDIKLSKVRI